MVLESKKIWKRMETIYRSQFINMILLLRSTPHPVTVTTRIITFLVGDPYKPSFATVTELLGGG